MVLLIISPSNDSIFDKVHFCVNHISNVPFHIAKSGRIKT